MQQERTTARYARTETPGIFKHANRYVAQWNENGKRIRRSFPTYAAACAFRRDYVIPYRERRALPPTIIAPGRRGGGWVYAFQSRGPDAAVKIGWSGDPARRLSDVSGAHPYGLDLMLLVPGTRALERMVHERLAHLRLEREWFSREALDGLAALLWQSVMAP